MILDEGALLATTSTYIDLNPVAAKTAEAPETSEHTSVKQRPWGQTYPGAG